MSSGAESSGPSAAAELLLETLGVRAGRPTFLEEHLTRLQCSARSLGHDLRTPELLHEHVCVAATHVEPGAALRVALLDDGSHALRVRELARPAPGGVSVSPFVLSCWPWDEHAQHKIAGRALLEEALADARSQGAWEALLVGPEGQLGEGARSTLIAVVGGRACTPPLEAGVLPGVGRAALIGAGALVECALSLYELQTAQELLLVNSVQGVVPLLSLRGLPGRFPGAAGAHAQRLAARFRQLERRSICRQGR